ncbi:MAG: pyridoxamine 5-phosphate oxidase family protein [Planctomycetaceae bacterium]|nr:pyridoxamine 5-phosphate oxidase family protein [Planctomycetaceae bacterium]
MLLIPDRLGNKRVDSYRNILETGRIGLLFLIPGFGETLHINGRAILITNEVWLTTLTVQGKRPKVAVAVEVQESFLPCAKAIIRSKIWEPYQGEAPASRPGIPQYRRDGISSHIRLRTQAIADGGVRVGKSSHR